MKIRLCGKRHSRLRHQIWVVSRPEVLRRSLIKKCMFGDSEGISVVSLLVVSTVFASSRLCPTAAKFGPIEVQSVPGLTKLGRAGRHRPTWA